MTHEEQAQFVTDLCDSIRDSVLGHIAECRVPDEWDGYELRQLLAEMFWRERGFIHTRGCGRYFNPAHPRVLAYRNTVITNNLDR